MKIKNKYALAGGIILTGAIMVLLAFLSNSPLILPTASASEDIFLDAGFIKARNPVPALEFTLEDLNGRPVDFKSFEGKTTLLYFWATW